MVHSVYQTEFGLPINLTVSVWPRKCKEFKLLSPVKANALKR